MNKLTHIETILESIRDDSKYSDDEKSRRYDYVDEAVSSYVTYHNEAVDQGRLLSLARFRMDFDEFAQYVERLHERRKEMHKSMIDHTRILNQLCEDQGLSKIYTGPLSDQGRKDNDTRFGVAEFGEELCRDLFKTTHEYGVPAKAREAYKDHAKRVTQEGRGWSMLQRMIERADAQKNMDATPGIDK